MAKTSENRSNWLKNNQNEQKIQIKSNEDTLFHKRQKKKLYKFEKQGCQNLQQLITQWPKLGRQ